MATMLFWLQKKDDDIDIDTMILKSELNKEKYMYSYDEGDIEYFKDVLKSCKADKNMLSKIIPVGNLDFVQMFLLEVYGTKNMYPIEVPNVLREERFLKRRYSIVKKERLPKEGYYFTKYVSRLKSFSHVGMIEFLQNDSDFLKDGLYQVSEVVDILSEYRCFVHHDRLVAVNYYDGNPSVFPDFDDIKLMIKNYTKDSTRPEAYAMDIAIISGRGTAILEVHPWVSIGLYGYVFDTSLPHCYKDGFLYYVETNKNITEYGEP